MPKIVVTVLLVLMVIPVHTGFAQDDSECDPNTDYITLRDEAFADADYELVIEVATCLLELDPTDGVLYYDRAIGYYETDQPQLALADLALAIEYAEFDEFQADPHKLRGVIYYEMGEDDLALREFATVLNLIPEDDEFYTEYIEDIYSFYSEEEINAVRATLPTLTPIPTRVASEDLPEVEEEESPVDAIIPVFETGDYLSVISLVTEALGATTAADVPLLHMLRGEAYQFRDDHQGALFDFEAAIEAAPAMSDAHLYKGISHLYEGDDELALEAIEAALRSNPVNDIAYTYFGILHQYMGDDERAIELFTTALTINPENQLALAYRGLSYYLSGDTEAAFENLDQALALDEENALAHLFKGQIYFFSGEDDLALAELDLAVEESADNPLLLSAAHTFGGLVNLYAGELETAIDDFTSALEADADNRFARFFRGKAYEANDMSEEAEQDFTLAGENADELVQTLLESRESNLDHFRLLIAEPDNLRGQWRGIEFRTKYNLETRTERRQNRTR
ncbi:MAG: tetratricopeptide repeat protein [Chloroflexi bacterium]|nr:tetratricopeptide repeat protein [Chloroflexota bacterium]